MLNKYDKKLPNINQSGNPIVYYKSLINFLDNSKIHLLEYNIVNNININDLLINEKNLPHLILLMIIKVKHIMILHIHLII